MKVKYLIIGAGPTGLGAAWRLNELGVNDWCIIEASHEAGGLAGSVIDDAGYTWDMGGHIQFSHYDYFDALMDDLLGPDEWLHHERESWVWLLDRFVPYPFQNNLRYLPREAMWDCVQGLIQLWKTPPTERPKNFGEWAEQTFGEGICNHFMRPYNFKVWAYPMEQMAFDWIGDRVAVADLERAVGNILLERDDVSWGPNATFRFPRHGGTGSIWRKAADRLPTDNFNFNSRVTSIDTKKRIASYKNATGDHGEIVYEHLISTMPLNHLVDAAGLSSDPPLSAAAAKLKFSSTHIIGIGVKGKPRDEVTTKCWMYFPESNSPFYRVTVFSNYSPNNVPDINNGWSLMCEVSESPEKPVDHATVVPDSVKGALATRLIENESDVIHTFHRHLPLGYPTPSLERDAGLDVLLPALEQHNIYSRGRFGAWKYEVSNQDHSLMQGVEIINRLTNGDPEDTLNDPNKVNAPRKPAK